MGHLGRLGFSKIIGFPYVRLIFLKFVGRRFGRQLFRPKCAPRGRLRVQDERRTRKVRGRGRTWRGLTETLDRDFGQRLWTETLDRDFGQILLSNLARSSPVGRRIRHRALRDGVIGCSNMPALALAPCPSMLAQAHWPSVVGVWCFFFNGGLGGRIISPGDGAPLDSPHKNFLKPMKNQ